MISLTLTNVKNFMSHLLLKETFDNFSFIEGEIITFNTFRIDGYMQKISLILKKRFRNILFGKICVNFVFP